MTTLNVIDQNKKNVGKIDLNDDVFAVKVNQTLVHQVLKAQLAARRQGSAKTKTRSEMQGGGKKPHRQKGTGNARHGSRRSPIFVGGAQTFGPKPRSYEQKTPKAMVRGALRSALSDRLQSDRLLVINEFKLKDHKTKTFSEVMNKNLQIENVLIVDEENKNLEMASRNLPRVKLLRTEGVNVYDLIKHEWIVLSQAAAERLNERLAPSKTTTQKVEKES